MPDSLSSSGQSTEEEYFLPTELVLHNKPDDCWVSCLGGVYDLTEYVTKNADSPISKYLVAHGGKDVSHWFESSVRSGCGCEARLRRFVSPATGLREILLPFNTPKPESAKWSSMVPESKGRCCDCGCIHPDAQCDHSEKSIRLDPCHCELFVESSLNFMGHVDAVIAQISIAGVE